MGSKSLTSLVRVVAVFILIGLLQRGYAWGRSGQPLDEPMPLASHLLPDVVLMMVVLGIAVAFHTLGQQRRAAPRFRTA